MTTLTDFLLARIEEDDAAARDAELHRSPDRITWEVAPWELLVTSTPAVLEQTGGLPLITISTERVQAECHAKRRIVSEHELTTDTYSVSSKESHGYACTLCFGSGPGEPAEDLGACETLLALARVYADHPNFDEDWTR